MHVLLRLQKGVQLPRAVILGDQHLCELGDVLLGALRPHGAVRVQEVAHIVVVQRVPGELESLGADLLKDGGDEVAHKKRRRLGGAFAEKRGIVRLHRLQHKRLPVPGGHSRDNLEAGAHEVHHLLPALVAHRHVLRVSGHGHMLVWHPHVPDHQVGQIVGVIEAAAAGLRNDAVRQVVGGEAEVRDRLIVVLNGGSLLVLDVDAVVLHKLVAKDRVWALARGVEELVEAVSGAVVRAGRAQDVKLLQPQVLLHGAHRLHLAADADEQQLLHVRQGLQCGQNVQVRAEARLHTLRSDDVRNSARHNRFWRETVFLVTLHAHHCVHLTTLQHVDSDLRHDTCPLCRLHTR
mmetsp:Transcript_43346/g.72255  ORF Transcript_43346/g.72255 Transcript_43346/m.72255 type:complete len:349 (-) Transcript_43346:534-1580(-)